MTKPPRLTIGLPVYNGENYLAESIESLLGQTYEDFELIISDNASTDGTPDICSDFRKRDSRIRYFRQQHNIGLSPNHNFTVAKARGELFKWAAHDDLYGRDLLRLCVEALDTHQDVILAHCWTARIDDTGKVVKAERYPLKTASPSAPARFRSTLFGNGGDDDGGVIRADVLRRIKPYGSFYHADRTAVSELVLYGKFYQVPQWLFYRRDHAERAEWKFTDARSWCANLDPKRANSFRNPLIRLYLEYVWGYVNAIHSAPLTPTDRRACYSHLLDWLINRAFRRSIGESPVEVPMAIDITSLVAGRKSDDQ